MPAAGAGDPTYVAAKQRRDRWIQELDALQRGTAVTAHHIDGVSGFGSWFDGSNDHLEFPLTFNQPATTGASFQESAQSFSISFWMLQTAQ